MPTIHRKKSTDISPAPFNAPVTIIPVSLNQSKKLKIRESISWSVCFAIIAGLTGMLKLLKIGVTMDSINSFLFFFSLTGFAYFVSRVFILSKKPGTLNPGVQHELN